MLICGHCNKQPAMVHLAEAVERDGERAWEFQDLCDSCAREMGLPHAKLVDPMVLFQPFQLGTSREVEAACSQCGLKMSEFRRAGRLGCEKCYEAFGPFMKEILEKAHAGKSTHLGRGPGRTGEESGRRDDLEALQRRLKAAVDSEAYEEAARLRDRIRTLESDAAP